MELRSVVALAALALAACTDAPTEAQPAMRVPLEVAFRGNQCMEPEERTRLIQAAEVWSDWQRAHRQPLLGAPPESRDAIEIDFATSSVVVVAMGARPTAGYAIDLAERSATLADDTLTLRVRWQEPEPGALTAQVLTSPCIAVVVPTAQIGAVVVDKE